MLPDITTILTICTVICLTLIAWILIRTIQSKNMYKRRVFGFRALAFGTSIIGLYYIYWRYRHSLNLQALWFALPLVVAETYAYIDSLLFIIMMWKPTDRKSPPPINAAVDVYITTYNEDPEIVRSTLEAALEINWPEKKVYILDDGDRKEIRALAAECGGEVITRGDSWKGKPRHAKAGNINNALPQTSGEYILILDADQIPYPEIINNTIGYFRDDKMAFVQTPQYFYNIPENDPLGSDAPLFYGPILKGKDGWNSAFFCGSNALLRREALLQLGIIEYSKAMLRHGETTLRRLRKNIASYAPRNNREKIFIRDLKMLLNRGCSNIRNGEPLDDVFRAIRKRLTECISIEKDLLCPQFLESVLPKNLISSLEFTRPEEAIPILPISTISITEDMATSIRLHSLGWKSAYHHEILAKGLAPEDLGSALSQRLRWAQGTIQVFVKENPLKTKGLSLAQRLQYFTTMYSYFSGFAYLIFILSPMIFLFTGIAPVSAYTADFFWRLIPFLILNRLLFRMAAQGQKVRRSEQYSLALFPLWIKAVFSVLFGKKPSFVVTPKKRIRGRFLKLIRPQILCIILSWAACIYGIYSTLTGKLTNLIGTGVNVFWAIYNSISLLIIFKAALYNASEKVPKKENNNG